MSGVIPIHLHSSYGLIADQNVGGSVRVFDLSRLVNSGFMRFGHVKAYLKAINASIPHVWPTLTANGEGETHFAVGVEKAGVFVAEQLEIAEGRYTSSTLITAIETEINELIDSLDDDEDYDVTLSEDASGKIQVDRDSLQVPIGDPAFVFDDPCVIRVFAFRHCRFDSFKILGEYDFSGLTMTEEELLDVFENGTGGFDTLATIIEGFVPDAPSGAYFANVSVTFEDDRIKIECDSRGGNNADAVFGFCPTETTAEINCDWASSLGGEEEKGEVITYHFVPPSDPIFWYCSYANSASADDDTYPNYAYNTYGALNSYGDPESYPLGFGSDKPTGFTSYTDGQKYSTGNVEILGIDPNAWDCYTGTYKELPVVGNMVTGDFSVISGVVHPYYYSGFSTGSGTFQLTQGYEDAGYSDMRILFFSYKPFEYDGFLSRDSILAKKLGLHETSLTVMEESDLSLTFPFKIQKLDPTLLYIRVEIPGTDHMWSGDRGVVGVLPIRLADGYVEHFTNPNAFNVGVFLSDMDTLKVSILNENLTPVDLGYADWSLSFLIQEEATVRAGLR